MKVCEGDEYDLERSMKVRNMKKRGQKMDRQDIITGHSKVLEKVVSQDGEVRKRRMQDGGRI